MSQLGGLIPNSLFSRNEIGTEWWYYHGHLREGRREFGFHVAFFRQRTEGLTVGRIFPVRLATEQVWFAHFAITDFTTRRFHYGQLRAGSKRCGAAEDRYAVWVGDWRIGGDATRHMAFAKFGNIACELELTSCKPPICHGNVAESSTSSHWSYTRMQAAGTLTIDGCIRPVVGEAWMDREYGSQLLHASAAAWNWFGIQLDDGRELMVYDLRDGRRARSPHARACVVAADGGRTSLSADEFQLEAPRTLDQSSHRLYLSGRLATDRAPLELELSIRSYMPDHELDTYASTSLIYWEGPAAVQGRTCGRPTSGRCFIELVGYDRGAPRRHRFDFAARNWSVAGYALSELHKWSSRKGIVNVNG